MSGVKLQVVVNDQQITAVLGRLIATGQNLEPVMQDIAAYGEDSTEKRFQVGVAPDGTPWKPSWRVQERGGKTLIKSGHLQDISSDHGNDYAEWGSGLIYALIHQLGGEIRPKNKSALFFRLPDGSGRSVKKVTIPARPYLGINEQDEANIIDIVLENINAAIG